jgi:hypothetical protein
MWCVVASSWPQNGLGYYLRYYLLRDSARLLEKVCIHHAVSVAHGVQMLIGVRSLESHNTRTTRVLIYLECDWFEVAHGVQMLIGVRSLKSHNTRSTRVLIECDWFEAGGGRGGVRVRDGAT